MNHADTQTPDLTSALVTGVIGIALVLLIASLIIGPFEHHFFTDWVGTAFMAATPTQVIIGLLWQNSKPDFVNRLSPPLKGLALTGITVVAGAVVLSLMMLLVSGGHGITPMLVQYAIMTVVCAIWLVPIWQCWPMNRISADPFKFGLLTLVAGYLLAYVLWTVFFDYSILGQGGHPKYYADVDPGGMFDMWTALVFFVTTAGVIIVHALFDFRPLDKISGGKGQPVRGIVGTIYILALSWAVQYVFVDLLGMVPVEYMVRVPVCMIFGTFLVNNMMQGALFPRLAQPVRGFALTACAAVAAVLMFELYAYASMLHTGKELGMGPGGNFELEIWIASAMLGVTFPVIFVVSGFFGFWPIKRR